MSFDKAVEQLKLRYQVLDEFEQRHNSAVYKVQDLNGRVFAIRIMKPDVFQNADEVEKFKSEVQALLELQHSSVVTLYSVDTLTPDCPFIIMEFFDGQPITRFTANKPPSMRNFIEVFTQLCSALSYLHANGIVHGDLRPANVLANGLESEHVWCKLANSGMFNILSSSKNFQADANDFADSVFYCAPERVTQNANDVRSDIYSLGAIMFEVLTRRPPFVGEDPETILEQHKNATVPSVSKLSKNRCPIYLEQMVMKCLSKDPNERYQNLFDLRSDLRLLSRGEEPLLQTNSEKDWIDEDPDFAKIRESGVMDKLSEKKAANTKVVAFTGRLSFDLRVSNVLERVLELGVKGKSILRFRSEKPKLQGALYIRDANVVLGAAIDGEKTRGYDALKALLSIADGEFEYVSRLPDDHPTKDESMRLSLNLVCFLYPQLPDTLGEFQEMANERGLALSTATNLNVIKDLIENRENLIPISELPQLDSGAWQLKHTESVTSSDVIDIIREERAEKDRIEKGDKPTFKYRKAAMTPMGFLRLVIILALVAGVGYYGYEMYQNMNDQSKQGHKKSKYKKARKKHHNN
ncbi:MAG: serine/threonine-protein kinase [Candidatus Melainabacteria bacterium]|nr:serine/threonine-protein kinase [Candidatus Melainabacteria bacterium]